MLRWVWWTVLGGLVFAACGGSSMRRDGDAGEGGSNDDGVVGGLPGAGGAAGSGTPRGGTSPTGGSGASAGRGGTTGGTGPAQGGRSGSGGDGAQAGEPATGGDAGGGGAPACELAGGVTCSFEESCDVLGCGTAWSRYDEHRCLRTSCLESGLCEGGERCVAAPVGGRFDDPCGNEADSCDPTSSGCECIFYEECFPSASCLPVDKYPPENDCPIAELDCDELEQAVTTLEGYLSGAPFLIFYELPGNLVASIEACSDAALARYADECS